MKNLNLEPPASSCDGDTLMQIKAQMLPADPETEQRKVRIPRGAGSISCSSISVTEAAGFSPSLTKRPKTSITGPSAALRGR